VAKGKKHRKCSTRGEWKTQSNRLSRKRLGKRKKKPAFTEQGKFRALNRQYKQTREGLVREKKGIFWQRP